VLAKSQKEAVARVPIINYALKSEVAIMLNMLHLLQISNDYQCKKFSAMNPGHIGKFERT